MVRIILNNYKNNNYIIYSYDVFSNFLCFRSVTLDQILLEFPSL
jgi:hypothetical protein